MAFRSSDPGEPRGGAQTLTAPETSGIHKPDLYIWGIYGVLVVLSIIELYS